MALISGIFNSINGDRRYDAKWFARYFATFIGNGVFPNPSTGLQVMESLNMKTIVKPGDGWISGYFLVNDGDYVLQHDIADGVLKRIDRIVMQLDYHAKRKIDIVIKKGVYASTPVAPVLQRDADVYELALADVHISNGATFISQANIVDTRLNKALCGIVHGTVDQVDTTTIFNQYQYWMTQQKAKYESETALWTTQKQQEFDQWQSQEKADFDNWFLTIQDILNGNVTANLQVQIDKLSGRIVAVEEKVTTHMADNVAHIQAGERDNWNAKATPENVRTGIEQTAYSIAKSLPDAEGSFTTVEYKRKTDGKLAVKSVLSGGVAPMYTTRTITYYGVNGTTVEKTDVFILTYNADGVLIGEV